MKTQDKLNRIREYFEMIEDTEDLQADSVETSLIKDIDVLNGSYTSMLEALKDLLEICKSRGEKLGVAKGGPVIEKAEQAIKQAEGA